MSERFENIFRSIIPYYEYIFCTVFLLPEQKAMNLFERGLYVLLFH